MENLEQLVSSAIQGNSDAFNCLYNYSFDTVKVECLKVLHNSIDAEDAIQETYIHIYKRLNTLKEPKKFLGWCRMIAHNTSVDYIVKHQRKAGKDDYKPPVSDETYEGMDSVKQEDNELSPEERTEQEMLLFYLQQAIDSLPPQRATAFALYQQGRSYQEISNIMSIPLGTVKSNVHYAKKALQKEIQKIERKEGIQIFGFVLVPVSGKVEVRLESPQNSGFIQAKTSAESGMKEEIWSNVSKKISHIGASHGFLWKRIAIIAAALIVIGGGIILAIKQPGKQNLTNQTTIESSISTQATNQRGVTRPSSQVVNPSAGPNGQSNNRPRQQSVQNTPRPATTARTPAVRTQNSPAQTTERSTREVYTF